MAPSKDMTPLPKNFGKVFWNNQFKVKIELPTQSRFPSLKVKSQLSQVPTLALDLSLQDNSFPLASPVLS